MNILCNKQQLIEAVSNVQYAVANKAALAALEGIFVRAQGSSLFLAGFDMEIGITTTIDAVVKEPGEVVLSAKMFADIVRKMPGESIAIVTDERYNTIIRNEQTEFSIIGIEAGDFPELPKVEDGVSFSVSQRVLKSMIRQTLFAVAAPNDPRPIYTGTRFEVTPESLRLISVDGYRLAMRSEPIQSDDSMDFVVPGKTLQEILKLMGEDDDSNCNMIIGRRHILFEVENYVVISRLLDGEFMAYDKIILPDKTTEIRVNTRIFTEAVDRVSLVISDRLKSPLVCDFKDNAIAISCTTTIGSANDFIPAEIEGDEEEIGFNSRYLLDALKNSETDEVRIQLNGALKPMKIMPKEGDAFLFLVLPVRLKK